MKTFVMRYLPNNKLDWKDFTKLAFFSLASTLMFSINGFIDNFMVGHIYHAGMNVGGYGIIDAPMAEKMNEASIGGLGAAASWWFLVNSVGTFFLGSVGFFLSQYFNKGDHKMAQRATTTKMQIAFMWAIPFIILMAVIPQQMMNVFTHKGIYHEVNNVQMGTKLDPAFMNKLAADYVRIACISWLIWIFVIPQNQSLREVGKPQGGALAVLGALITHISLNFVFIKCTDLGVVGPAIALICSRVVNFIVSTLYVKYHKLPTSVWANPFHIEKEIYIKWIKRWSYLVYGIVWTVAISFRTFFWSTYFKQETGEQDKAVDAIVVLGIAGAVQNVFLVAFDSLQPLFSKYVSGNMGKDKMKEAKDYSNRIMGFGVLLSLFISLILVGIAFLVPHLTMVWDVNHETLQQVKECILVVALVYWSWVILSSVRTVMASGGRPGIMSIIDGGYTVLQSVWILVIGIIHHYTGAFNDFGIAYLVFFVSDVLKLPFFLIPYYKLEWTKNHTKSDVKKEEIVITN